MLDYSNPTDGAFVSKISSNRRGRSYTATMRTSCSFLCLLFLTGFVAGTAKGADTPTVSAALAPHGLPFAIADFDGDSRPDLADIHIRQSSFASSVYSIDLQMSAAGRRSIQLVAPVGGLRIAAQDVNGDEWMDLVVTTASRSQPVAVYLNDGRGGFTHASPDAFPKAFGGAKTNWTHVEQQMKNAVGAPPQPRGAGGLDMRWLSHLPAPAGFVSISSVGLFAGPVLIPHDGRAPPLEIPL